MHILTELANNIPLREVLAHEILRRPERGREYAIACRSEAAPHLSRRYPHDLSIMRCHRIAGIVLRDFAGPAVHGRRDVVRRPGTARQVLSVGAQGATAMLEHALVRPSFCDSREVVRPY